MKSSQSVPKCVHRSEEIAQLCLSSKCSNPFICTAGDCVSKHHDHSPEGQRHLRFDEFLERWVIARQVHTVAPFIDVLDDLQKYFIRFIAEQKAKLLMWASLLKQNTMDELSNSSGKELNQTWKLIKEYTPKTQTAMAEQKQATRQRFNQMLQELVVRLPTAEEGTETAATIKEPEEEISRTPEKRQEAQKKHVFDEKLRRCQADYSLVDELEPETSVEFLERGKLHEKQRRENAALEDYTRAIDLDPKNLMAIFKRAILHTSLKHYAAAQSDYSKYLLLDRSSAFIWCNRALILQAQGKLKEALSDLDNALQVEPLYEQALISRAKLLLTEKQYEKSLADFNKYIELNKKNASAYHGRGKIHTAEGRYQEAVDDLTLAHELDQTNIAVLVDRANCYHSLKNMDLSQRDYSEAIRCNSTIGSLYYNRAVIQLARKEEDKAIADLEKCLQLIPENEPAMNVLSGLYLAKKKYPEAERMLESMIRKCTDDESLISVRYNLATAKKYNNHLEAAIEDFNWVIEHSPNHLPSYLGRASVFMQLKNFGEALKDYTKSLELDPENVDIVYNIGVANDSQGSIEAARQHYSAVLLKQPNHLAALKARARCNFRLNDEQSFTEDSKRVRELEPDS